MKKLSQNEVIRRFREVHGNFYDYSIVEYKGLNVKVKIICPKHGIFEMIPYNHMKGHGCRFCCKNAKLNLENFSKIVNLLYGNRFDCSISIINNSNNRVKIKCNKCGNVFEVDKYAFTSTRNGGKCPFCEKEKHRVKRQIEFIKKCNSKFGDKFTYPNLFYFNNSTKIEIICPIHGSFYMTPQHHLNSNTGCPKCSIEKLKDKYIFSQKTFIERAKRAHGDKYSYEKSIYNGMLNPITITCPKHGDFQQLPINHIKGQGCRNCKNSIGEERISNFLKENNIKYKKEYCVKNEYIFSNRKKLFIDFYLPQYNTMIEFNGEQHYHAYTLFGGEKQLEEQKERDNAVRYYCKNHKIKLIEIPYTEINNIETILKKKLKIKRK